MGNIGLFIAVAILAPLLLVAVVGIPLWLIARRDENYVSLQDEYRAAIGLPALRKLDIANLPRPWSLLLFVLPLHLILKLIHPGLALTGMVIGFSCACFFLAKAAWKSWSVLRACPHLEARLRKVPVTETLVFTAAAVMAFGAVYCMVVIGAPEEFGKR